MLALAFASLRCLLAFLFPRPPGIAVSARASTAAEPPLDVGPAAWPGVLPALPHLWRSLSLGFLLIKLVLSLPLPEPARCICLLSCFAVLLIFQLELLIPDFFRNWFHAHRFRKILPERRRKGCGADHHRRVVKFLGYARWQINPAPAPRGIEYGVPKRPLVSVLSFR